MFFASDESWIVYERGYPSRSDSSRRMRAKIEWKVPIHSPPVIAGESSCPIRSRISRAALFVKVSASTDCGGTPCSSM